MLRPLLFFLVTLLPYSTSLTATDYYRCTNSSGNTTFSETPCSPEATLNSTKESYLGKKGHSSSQSAKDQLRAFQAIQSDSTYPSKTKTKNSKPEPCKTVNALQLRNARISNTLMKCHSQNDVRDIYGEPLSVSTWSSKSSYDTRWKYQLKEERIYVYFKDGIVTKWNSHK